MDFNLIYVATIFVAVVLALATIVLLKIEKDVELEVRKIRFAAAMFTGILVMFVFCALLYLADSNTGEKIFTTAVTSMTPLAGAMMGYIFGTRGANPSGQ